MNVLSLFDGMACGMLALIKSNIKVDRYVAYEIDKYATQTSIHNFPCIEHRGDVFEADFTEFKGFDYLIGGSPCTYWSIAQKSNRETEASGTGWELFSQYVRALREAQPKYFVYENNKSMSAAIRESISNAFGFEPICINSALVSAQNRQRLYWVGRRNSDGTYDKVIVKQPQDKGILLKNALDGVVQRIPPYGNSDKARLLNAHYSNDCGGFEHRMFSDNPKKQQVDMISEPVRVGAMPRPNGELSTSQAFRVYDVDAKSVNITANGGGAGGKTGLYAVPINYAAPIEFEDNKPIKAISGADCKIYTVYEIVSGIISIKSKQYPIKLPNGFYIIRKLTVSECKRLQTVPDWYDFSVVSDTQAYKMLGNGWTIDVIAHLLQATKTASGITDADFKHIPMQMSLFDIGSEVIEMG